MEITGLSKSRIESYEAQTIVSGSVVNDNLVLTKRNGATVIAGNVRGPQGISSGGIPKVSMATTENYSLSGLGYVDNEMAVAGDLILVKNQTNGIENGIYVASSGTWPRWDQANDLVKLTALGVVQVLKGSVNGGTRWVSTARGTGVFDASRTIWTRVLEANPTWQNLMLNGNWSAIPNNPPQIIRVNGLVYLRGGLRGGTLPSEAISIPSSYRPENPAASTRFIVPAGDGTDQGCIEFYWGVGVAAISIFVQKAEVDVNNNDGMRVFLDGISYPRF